MIGDGQSVALTARGGSTGCAWCVSGQANDAVFAYLSLYPERGVGGCFDVLLARPYRVERRYLPHAPMLETHGTDVARMLDFMPAPTEAQKRTHPIASVGIQRWTRVEQGDVALRVEVRAGLRLGGRRRRCDAFAVELHRAIKVFPRTDARSDSRAYRGSQPMRLSNGAENQFQPDAYGDLTEALALYQRSGGRFDWNSNPAARIAKFLMKPPI